MSDSSQIPPGNRPPVGRVFRPFAGGSAEQGSQSPSAAPDSRALDRRPMQPRRPFIGGQSAPSNTAAAPAAIHPAIDVRPALEISPAIDVSTATEVAASAPAVEATHATAVERATWLTIVEEEPAVLDCGTDLIGESVTLGDALEIGKTSELPLELPAPAEENFAPSFVERTFSAPEKLPVVTAEYAEPDPLDAPLFIAPNSEPAADSLIDEVDAAFITAGLPSAGAPSDDALRAATALEEVARRLRAGDLDLQHGATASISSEESALATVLAALLANR